MIGAGPRVCIGAWFAIDATILLTSLVRAAAFEVPPGHVPLSRIALPPKGGIPVKVQMRDATG